MLSPWAGRNHPAGGLTPAGAGDVVGRPVLSDNARLAQLMFPGCGIPGRGDGIGRRSGLKHRRRKAWGFDFPPRHQQGGRIAARWRAGRVAGMMADPACTRHLDEVRVVTEGSS